MFVLLCFGAVLDVLIVNSGYCLRWGAREGIGFYELAASSDGCTHTPSVARGASSLSEGALGNWNSGRCLQRVHVFSDGELYYYAVVFAARVLGRIKYH